MFADALNSNDRAAFQALGLRGRRRLERLAMRSEPHIGDAIAAHTFMNPARNGLHFGQFGHCFILGLVSRLNCAAPIVDSTSTTVHRLKPSEKKGADTKRIVRLLFVSHYMHAGSPVIRQGGDSMKI